VCALHQGKQLRVVLERTRNGVHGRLQGFQAFQRNYRRHVWYALSRFLQVLGDEGRCPLARHDESPVGGLNFTVEDKNNILLNVEMLLGRLGHPELNTGAMSSEVGSLRSHHQ